MYGDGISYVIQDSENPLKEWRSSISGNKTWKGFQKSGKKEGIEESICNLNPETFPLEKVKWQTGKEEGGGGGGG